jgi:hypothetical protein
MARYTPPTRWTNADEPLTLGFTVESSPIAIFEKRVSDVYVVLRWHYADPVANRLAGTVDNKAGYGSAEAAQNVARQCAGLLAKGVEVTYDPACWTTRSAGLVLRWQQFSDAGYCDRDGGPSGVEADGEPGIASWEVRVAFYRWLEAQVKRRTKRDMRDPRNLVETLRKLGAVPLLSWNERKARYGDDHCGWIATTYEDVLARLPVKPEGERGEALAS